MLWGGMLVLFSCCAETKAAYGRKGLSELTVQGCHPPWSGWQKLETTLPAVSTVRKQREVHARAQLAFYVPSSLGA